MGLSRTANIINIDIDPAEIGKNMETDIPLVGDARLILQQLNEKLGSIHFTDWTAELRSSGAPQAAAPRKSTVSPKKVVQILCEKADKDAVLVADVGQNQIWSARGFAIENGRFLTSGGMGTMGYSVSASYGAKLACPDRQVICICGDGSFQMQMMELATICANQIPVKIIVMNNMRLGMVKELQDKQYAGNEAAVSLEGNPDFVKLAAAYGINAGRICSDEKIADAIEKLLQDPNPCLLECTISPDEPTL